MAVPGPISFPDGHNEVRNEEVEEEGDHGRDDKGLGRPVSYGRWEGGEAVDLE